MSSKAILNLNIPLLKPSKHSSVALAFEMLKIKKIVAEKKDYKVFLTSIFNYAIYIFLLYNL